MPVAADVKIVIYIGGLAVADAEAAAEEFIHVVYGATDLRLLVNGQSLAEVEKGLAKGATVNGNRHLPFR